MSPRLKLYSVIGVGMIGVWTFFLSGHSNLNPLFTVVPLGAACAVASMNIRCPACKRPVAYLGPGPSPYGMWGPFCPRKCRTCGHDLAAG